MGRQEQRIKELVLSKVAKCGQCGEGYHTSDVNVLGHKEDLWFLMLICGQCHQAVGVAAVVKEQSLAASASGEAEAARTWESKPALQGAQEASLPPNTGAVPAKPVDADDVAAVHDFLKDFDGNFKRLFDTNS